MVTKRDHGIHLDRTSPQERSRLISYINIKLESLGLPIYSKEGTGFVQLAADMLESFRQKERLLPRVLPPPISASRLLSIDILPILDLRGFRKFLPTHSCSTDMAWRASYPCHLMAISIFHPPSPRTACAMESCTTPKAIAEPPKGYSILWRAVFQFPRTKKPFPSSPLREYSKLH